MKIVCAGFHGVVEVAAACLSILGVVVARLDGDFLHRVHTRLHDLILLSPEAIGCVLAIDPDERSSGAISWGVLLSRFTSIDPESIASLFVAAIKKMSNLGRKLWPSASPAGKLNPVANRVPASMDRQEVEQDWKRRGFSCGLWIDPPGQRWEDFTHDTDELVMVVDGTVEFEIGGRIHHPEPGKELLIPAHVRHSVRNTGTTTAHWLYGYRR
jgi:mannose-6-phosphate isomerase-like protein (cupin superfamily)